MLVRRAETLHGGLARVQVSSLPVEAVLLAETLRPELAVPVRDIFQLVHVRHHDGHRLALVAAA